mmetsp:Transcript_29115/g.86210  ORF Transcript_29115/g.86210 Transcript_29115/m.86210 type:complete len:222 (+) Transcript_29115:105-770(+)
MCHTDTVASSATLATSSLVGWMSSAVIHRACATISLSSIRPGIVYCCRQPPSRASSKALPRTTAPVTGWPHVASVEAGCADEQLATLHTVTCPSRSHETSWVPCPGVYAPRLECHADASTVMGALCCCGSIAAAPSRPSLERDARKMLPELLPHARQLAPSAARTTAADLTNCVRGAASLTGWPSCPAGRAQEDSLKDMDLSHTCSPPSVPSTAKHTRSSR